MGGAPVGRFAVGPEDDPDRYVIDQPIRLGGEGVVYRCSRNGAPFAVKVRHAARVAGIRAANNGDADLLVRVDHPGLVRVHERFAGAVMHPVGADPGPARSEYLVMEWVEGPTLAEAVEHGMSTEDIVSALAPVADVLDRLRAGTLTNDVRVVHGDVKPDNILVRSDGSAVLVDVGLMRQADLVLPGAGSAGYRPPALVPQSDVYGLAGVVFYTLTKHHPPDDVPAMSHRLRAHGYSSRLLALVCEARTSRHDDDASAWLHAVSADMAPNRIRRFSSSTRAATLALVACGVAFAWWAPGVRSSPLSCDAAAWASEAHALQTTMVDPVSWVDTDGDCLHDAYEINAVGSDPAIADANDALLRAPDRQLDYLVEVHGLLHSEVWLDPATCDPETWAAAAADWQQPRPNVGHWSDPDGDCLTTVHEQVLGTDPTSADSDADGFVDSVDRDSSNGLIEPLDVQLSASGPVAAQPPGQPPRVDRPRSAVPDD